MSAEYKYKRNKSNYLQVNIIVQKGGNNNSKFNVGDFVVIDMNSIEEITVIDKDKLTNVYQITGMNSKEIWDNSHLISKSWSYNIQSIDRPDIVVQEVPEYSIRKTNVEQKSRIFPANKAELKSKIDNVIRQSVIVNDFILRSLNANKLLQNDLKTIINS